MINELFNTTSRDDIINQLEKAGLSPDIVDLIRNDEESHNLLMRILSGMTGSLEERILQINRLAEVIRSTEKNQG